MNLHAHTTVETVESTAIEISKKELEQIFRKIGVIENDETCQIFCQADGIAITKTRTSVESETRAIGVTFPDS